MKRQLSANLGNLLLSLSEITDLANTSIAQHQQRTAFISFEVAKCANLEADLIENIFTAALLHDIGAISVEEKLSIHNFEPVDETIHAIKGEILLNKIPWLKKISKIVRNHHTRLRDWEEDIDNKIVLASQIVLLSDYVERLIDRNKYILHQRDAILDTIKKMEDTIIHKKVIEYFVDVSKREEFWLDLVSPRLYPLLLHTGPFKNMEIELEHISLMATLYRDLIDFKSRFTATHTSGVSACAEIISKIFGLTELEINSMIIAGNFHDIGKLIIPNKILEKPGKLTSDEFAIMKSHTYFTYYTINSIGGLEQIAEWAAYHHEKLDGSGYPFHCKSGEIDTGSRIIAIADIFTAISEDRPYRKGMEKDESFKVLKTQTDSGLLDKKIVELLFDNYDCINKYVKGNQALSMEFYENRFWSIRSQDRP